MWKKDLCTYYNRQVSVVHLHKGTNSIYKMRKINHESKQYFYKHYISTPEVMLLLSDFTNWIAEAVYKIYRVIKDSLSKYEFKK